MPRPSDYEFLDYNELPDALWDELGDRLEMRNGTGQIVNPEYHPKLTAWLEANGHDVKCYILWASW